MNIQSHEPLEHTSEMLLDNTMLRIEEEISYPPSLASVDMIDYSLHSLPPTNGPIGWTDSVLQFQKRHRARVRVVVSIISLILILGVFVISLFVIPGQSLIFTRFSDWTLLLSVLYILCGLIGDSPMVSKRWCLWRDRLYILTLCNSLLCVLMFVCMIVPYSAKQSIYIDCGNSRTKPISIHPAPCDRSSPLFLVMIVVSHFTVFIFMSISGCLLYHQYLFRNRFVELFVCVVSSVAYMAWTFLSFVVTHKFPYEYMREFYNARDNLAFVILAIIPVVGVVVCYFLCELVVNMRCSPVVYVLSCQWCPCLRSATDWNRDGPLLSPDTQDDLSSIPSAPEYTIKTF